MGTSSQLSVLGGLGVVGGVCITSELAKKLSEDEAVLEPCVLSHCHVRLFPTPWTVARQAPLSMGILQGRILEWVDMPFSREIFPTQGLNLDLLHCKWVLYQLSYQGSPDQIQEWRPEGQVHIPHSSCL